MEVCECCIYEFFEKHFCSDAHFLFLSLGKVAIFWTRLGPFEVKKVGSDNDRLK